MKKALISLLALVLLVFAGGLWAVAQEEAPAGEATEKAEVAKPETISGTISMVDTQKKLVVLAGSGGVPFNFKVTGATRIKVAGKRAKLADLAGQTNKSASVKFLPLRSGNLTQSIEVSE
jgi:hypothetical protein